MPDDRRATLDGLGLLLARGALQPGLSGTPGVQALRNLSARRSGHECCRDPRRAVRSTGSHSGPGSGRR
jgi:hypothetical protein